MKRIKAVENMDKRRFRQEVRDEVKYILDSLDDLDESAVDDIMGSCKSILEYCEDIRYDEDFFRS